MILEPIKDFVRAPFCEECQAASSMSVEDALATAKRLEDRAIRYYSEAAAKIKALPEVARALKLIGKKHNAHIERLNAV
jgi:rubrerythrin